jgi:multiple sugar transport system permease protein
MDRAPRPRRARGREALIGYLFASPVILGLIVWVMVPMVGSLLISFTDWNVLTAPHWLGLLNYVRLFTVDLFFAKSLLVTVYYVALNTALTFIYSLALALLLNQKVKGQGIYRSVFYLPAIVPLVASSALWLWLFNPDFGLFNQIFLGFGLRKSLWLAGQPTVIPSLVLMSVWGGAGNTIVIFLAALQGVPRQLLEAVEIDGGGWWHKFWAVTWPMISPVTFFNIMVGLINSFQIFTQSYIMTSGGPNNASLFYVYLMYREGFERNNMGDAAALSWILFLIVSLLGIVLFRWSREWVHYEGANA